MAMFIWKATFIDFEENYHAYVYMRPTFIQHSRVYDLNKQIEQIKLLLHTVF